LARGAIWQLRWKRLETEGHKRPDLFLLDMYYGPGIPPAQRKEIADADDAVSNGERTLRQLLTKAGLSPQKGFELADSAGKRFAGVPRVFFSRKAFLEDALRAQKEGLPVVEKPDPIESDRGTPEQRYDSAMKRSTQNLSLEFDQILDRESCWGRHHVWLSGVALGSFFFFFQLLWQTLEDTPSRLHTAEDLFYLLASVCCLVFAWKWHWRPIKALRRSPLTPPAHTAHTAAPRR
jgi:hypothetical protein